LISGDKNQVNDRMIFRGKMEHNKVILAEAGECARLGDAAGMYRVLRKIPLADYFDLQYRVADDWRIYIELCVMNGKVVYESEPLNGHQRHVKSVIRQNNHLDEVIAIQDLAASLITLNPAKLEQIGVYREVLKKHFEAA